MQALAAVGFEPAPAALPITLGAIGRAALHGRQNGDQPGLRAALLQEALDDLLLALAPVAHVVNLQTGLTGLRLGAVADLFTPAGGPVGEIVKGDVMGQQIMHHPLAVAQLRQGAGDDHAV